MFYKSYTNYQKHFEGHRNQLFTSFKQGSSLTRLIYINCGIFLALKVIYIFFVLIGKSDIFYPIVMKWLAVPSDLKDLFYYPWTLGSYMFIQMDFLHLLFNMLWLYWFGSCFLNYFSQKQLTGVYLLGGLLGALLYIVAYNLFPYFNDIRSMSSAIGASASVMAIVFAVCTYLPQHKVYIFLLGPVKLIYLALFTALIDLLSIPYDNPGGHIAHLGGALFGWLFIQGIRKNIDLSSGIIKLLQHIGKFFFPQKKIKVSYKRTVSEMNDQEYNAYKKEQENRINAILDKISKSGYESLSKEEKEILFKGKN